MKRWPFVVVAVCLAFNIVQFAVQPASTFVAFIMGVNAAFLLSMSVDRYFARQARRSSAGVRR